MSSQITTAFVEQYSANIQMLSQQMGSLLRDAVRIESIVGKDAYFDQIGKVTAQLKVSRHSDTPQIDTPHSRRRCSLADYEFADLIDQQDKVRLLIDPTSSYAKAAAYAMGRAMDDVIIAAALGTANTGVSGGTAVALPAANITAVGTGGANTMNIAKLALAKQKLDAGDVDPSIKRHIVVSPTEIQDLLNNTTVTSSDFNTVKALVQGEIDSFMGFKFHVSNRLTTNGAGNTQCIAFAEDGILLGIGKDVTARIDERSDKSYATQVYYCQTIGATRMEEAKVISVLAN
ncbi:major capsid protein [Pelagibacter phage Skadi-4 EXVC104P]|jgi:hypothetical protein|nr:phage capsid protein [Ascidiaceihabitans sp.]MDC6481091.1 phage capsid protein [bacterium]UWJ03700.1 major capsid protein [Pelagibacter phage Skadi-5 EXVC105P]UWJ03806.1 major capsid protein [Pelagibacter phage Skadi-6 EXVC106P]UWJ03816.1 major capsid protein [Pelagibacter phage Skadi-10 EXVC110P]UWJ03874.1 major capsid protein [Pelagibacter phage Skadi-8 EXVC108P]UWJ03945.1 major capsid protein [Pelagibacter phage Skadi-3 EXVC103P]UWJ03993.1 major capsid protein [Pelagibacter phage Skadi|tara:strand:- start:530 stop:1396 length:867 start_codon:yes stop_codon:yes gene_type:complete